MSRRARVRALTRFGHVFSTQYRYPYQPAYVALTTGNTVRLFSGSARYLETLIERIDAAVAAISLETYIFCDDAVGRRVSDALIKAAKRGVQVRIITDGLGTGRLPLFNDWLAAGIEHCIYNPHLFGRFGFSRTHRKIVVIDQRIAFCGGINIDDDVAPTGARLIHPRWDFALELMGPVVAQVSEVFELQWKRIKWSGRHSCSLRMGRIQRLPHAWAQRASQWRQGLGGGQRHLQCGPSEPSVAFIARDNVMNRHAIEKAYLAAIGHARTEVLLANPYFMPGHKLRHALMHAARRGVEVRLLIGRKEFIALDWAVRYLYRTLLGAGVHIAEYEKTLLHGKVAVVDSEWATVGSSNLDTLSLVLNNEANVVLMGHPEITVLRDEILTAFHEASSVSAACYAKRSFLERLLSGLAYVAYRTVMKILTIGGYD